MNPRLLLLVFILAPVLALAQVENDRSYSNVKKRAERSNLNELLSEAESLKEKAPGEALLKVKEALALSIARNDVITESRSRILLGDINMNIQEWKLALENYTTAFEKLGNQKVAASSLLKPALNGIARSNMELGNYETALQFFERLTRQNLNPGERIEATIGISEVYFRSGRYQAALDAFSRSAATDKITDPVLAGLVENQKAKIYARLNQVDNASRSLQSAQNRSRSNAPESEAAKPQAATRSANEAKEEIADVLEEQKRYDEKIDLLNKSIDYNIDAKNLSEVSDDKVALGKTLEAKGETSAAIRELEEAAFIADTIGEPAKQAEAYLSLAGLYDAYGNIQAANATYRKYSEAVKRSEKMNAEKLLEKSELIKTQRDIEEFSKYITVSRQEETLAEATLLRQQLIIYGLVAIILIIAFTSYFIYRNALASKTANQLLALKSLRSQMNPHFIFNALNSVNNFVSQNDERSANRFLSEFSRLMRLVLENSQEDFIPLNKEEEIISLYLKLEHYRFRDKFDYAVQIDDTINKEAVEIPPMLIQPYIENAVWHGLRYKESKGFLSVGIHQINEEVVVEITDNGIGRQRSAELKTENQKKHNSTGLKNIRERLDIINKVYKSRYRVEIEDITNDGGTKVKLFIPLKNHHLAKYA